MTEFPMKILSLTDNSYFWKNMYTYLEHACSYVK